MNPLFRKYPKIERLGSEDNAGIFSDPSDLILIQEKIDGGNAQFRVNDSGELLFGSRSQYLQSNQGQFASNIQWLASQLHQANALPTPSHIYYGEWCKKHTLNYDWAKIPPFLGFDIWDLERNAFLPWSLAKDEFARLNVPMVPVVWQGRVGDLDVTALEALTGTSVYRAEGPAEGLVIKNYGRCNVYGQQLFAKFVTDRFKEANHFVFGGGLRKLDDDTSAFITSYYTEPRIRKAILRLTCDGALPLGRPLMHHLPRAVAEDIWSECSWEIIRAFSFIDFSLVKKNAPKLCLRVLDDFINQNAMEMLPCPIPMSPNTPSIPMGES